MRAGALAAVIALTACTADRSAGHRRRDPGALVVAQAAEPLTLDPIRATDTESLEVSGLVFEGLVRWKIGSTDVEPNLATRWEVSPDAKRWKLHLRKGVTFHDGTAFDAAAVVFSFERLLDPAHPHGLGASGDYWRTLLKDVRRVRVLDASTVEIEMARPYSPLLGELAMFPIVSPPAVQKWGDAFQRHPVGTGPFAFESWTPNESIVVRRFAGYWGEDALLDRIVFRVVIDARQRLIDLESGTVDLASAIRPDEQPFVELHPDLRLEHTPGNDVSYLAFNMTKPPFDNRDVRRAANHAVNKEPIIKLAFQGRAIAADGPLPPTQWGYHKPRTRYEFDPVLAKKILESASATGAFDGTKRFKLYAPSTPRPYLQSPERVARFLQVAFERVGIHTDLVLQPYAEHRAAVEAGKHDLALFGWIGDTGDPDNFLYVLFHSDNSVVESAQNIAFYREPVVDQLLRSAQTAVDEPTRTDLYRSAQERIAEDCPWVPIAHSEYIVALRADLEGVVLSPLGHPVYARIRRRSDGR
ncbi:MAG TPA: ABC transporter substrate-binding protein [Kofleriaceae bacterium]|nr:ABC transporter substrate-binding protein [Kofleriaceae bacterium]